MEQNINLNVEQVKEIETLAKLPLTEIKQHLKDRYNITRHNNDPITKKNNAITALKRYFEIINNHINYDTTIEGLQQKKLDEIKDIATKNGITLSKKNKDELIFSIVQKLKPKTTTQVATTSDIPTKPQLKVDTTTVDIPRFTKGDKIKVINGKFINHSGRIVGTFKNQYIIQLDDDDIVDLEMMNKEDIILDDTHFNVQPPSSPSPKHQSSPTAIQQAPHIPVLEPEVLEPEPLNSAEEITFENDVENPAENYEEKTETEKDDNNKEEDIEVEVEQQVQPQSVYDPSVSIPFLDTNVTSENEIPADEELLPVEELQTNNETQEQQENVIDQNIDVPQDEIIIQDKDAIEIQEIIKPREGTEVFETTSLYTIKTNDISSIMEELRHVEIPEIILNKNMTNIDKNIISLLGIQ